jgi:hypothetical protein
MSISPDQIALLLNELVDGDRYPVEVLYPLINEHQKDVARVRMFKVREYKWKIRKNLVAE